MPGAAFNGALACSPELATAIQFANAAVILAVTFWAADFATHR